MRFKLLFENDFKEINGEIFNAGTENLKIIEIAQKVKSVMDKIYNRNDIDTE